MKVSYLAWTKHAHQLQYCIFCSSMPFFLKWNLNLIMLSALNSGRLYKWRLNNCSLSNGLYFFLFLSSVFLGWWIHCSDFHLCIQCPTKLVPWCFALDHVNYLKQLRNPHPWHISLWACSAFSAVKHLQCGKLNRGNGMATFVDLPTTYHKLKNLAMNGFAVHADKCAV